jgi:hypothetical protein
MSCHHEEMVANDVTRRLIGGHEISESDTENDNNTSDDDETVVESVQQRREDRGMEYSEYTLMKTWTTGDEAVMEEEDIQMEMFELTRAWMNESLLFKMPGQVDGELDFALWKCFRSYRTQSGSHSFRVFQCPMRYLCKCNAGIRIITGPTYISLYKRGEHVATSHDMNRKVTCRSLAYSSIDTTLFSSASAMVSEVRRGDPFAMLSPLERSIAECARNVQLSNLRHGTLQSNNSAECDWARFKRVRFDYRDAFPQVQHT